MVCKNNFSCVFYCVNRVYPHNFRSTKRNTEIQWVYVRLVYICTGSGLAWVFIFCQLNFLPCFSIYEGSYHYTLWYHIPPCFGLRIMGIEPLICGMVCLICENMGNERVHLICACHRTSRPVLLLLIPAHSNKTLLISWHGPVLLCKRDDDYAGDPVSLWGKGVLCYSIHSDCHTNKNGENGTSRLLHVHCKRLRIW